MTQPQVIQRAALSASMAKKSSAAIPSGTNDRQKKSNKPQSLIGGPLTISVIAFFTHCAILLFGCRDSASLLTQQYCQNAVISKYLTPHWMAAAQIYEPISDRSLPSRLFTLAYRVVPTGEKSSSWFWSDLYGKGPEDAMFIVGCILLFTIVQHYAQRFYCWLAAAYLIDRNSVKDSKDLRERAEKFADQAYLGSWYLFAFCAGYALYRAQPYYPLFENSHLFWADYPMYRLPGYIKLYYLVDASFWLQQLLQFTFFTPPLLRRKDHMEMTIHHAITSTLLLASYALHFTPIGNVVLFVFYAADIFLCLAKCMKYTGRRGLRTACDATFAVFVLTWIYTRHYVFFYLMYSLLVESAEAREAEGVESDAWFTRDFNSLDDWKRPGLYVDRIYYNLFLGLFAGLQTLLLIWLGMIFKVIIKVVSGKGAEDVREDE